MAEIAGARRSSRARTTLPQSKFPSATSSASGKPERSTRAFTKTGSPQKSTGSGSLSSEPPDESPAAIAATTEQSTVLRRRSMRGKDDDRDKQPKTDVQEPTNARNDIEMQEDDEAVRCVCSFDDYPGPPPLAEDSKQHSRKGSIDLEPVFSVDPTDEMAGFFVQCDACRVWQHGACVGITTEEASPDEYFCEQCRNDLHKVYTASNGHMYSIYLPVHQPSRAPSSTTSAARDDPSSKSPKIGERKSSARLSSITSSAKRRSTMNSRDAAYDEEEQLQRAIEASKEDTIVETYANTDRRPKRGRDEEEPAEPVISKRQKTDSKSPSPLQVQQSLASRRNSQDDESTTRNAPVKKSARNAARSQREQAERAELREEQERKRAEAASKRQGRAARRRADDTASSDEPPLAAKDRVPAVETRPAEVHQAQPVPPASSPPLARITPPTEKASVSAQKKKGAGVHKKKGRNQYTKDRVNQEVEKSGGRSASGDGARGKDEHAGSRDKKSAAHEAGGKHNTRLKGGISKVTMPDLKRRARALMEFISRTQQEMAREGLGWSDRPSPGGSSTTDEGVGGHQLAKDFKQLSCVEMMDELSRDLVKWQQEYET